MSETTDKIVDKIVGDATSRLKIPIVSTYLCILIINNWDILYYIMFSKVDATSKILYVKTHYDFGDYLLRVGGSLIYAIAILVLFTFLDYYLVKYLKDISIKKKGIQQQIVDHSTIDELNTALSIQINEVSKIRSSLARETESNIQNLNLVTKLTNEINNLKTDNINLNSTLESKKNYIKFGKLIEEITELKNGTEHSTLHYLEELLLYFNNHKNEELTYFKINEELNPADKIELRIVFYDIIIKLVNYDYLTINESNLSNTTIIFIMDDIIFLNTYLNID